MDVLLAKKTRYGELPITLKQHTEDVSDAAVAMFGSEEGLTRLGLEWCRFFKLDQVRDGQSFVNNLLAASLFHDWGKANDGMQAMLSGAGNGQLFRHEHLSVMMLGLDSVDQWVRQRGDIDWDIVLAAVGSHHLKFGDSDFGLEAPNEAIRVRVDHADFQEQLIPLISKRLHLRGSPAFPASLFWGFTGDAATFDPSLLRDRLRDGRLRNMTLECRDTSCPKTQMLNAVRSALIAADAVGSGLRRTRGKSGAYWVREQFTESDLCDFRFIQRIVATRVEQLNVNGKWNGATDWDGNGWNEFQKACDNLPARSLLLAPCGAGKTLAAWRWIAARTKHRPVKRVLFLYPTRATATEGFKDYVSWAPEADASLIHGTASYDLDEMFPIEDPRSDRVFNDTDPRLFALRHWSKRVFSATIDQFFAFLSYGYGPMCLLPVLVDSVIVVDEVHSFDRAMFSALLGFLNAFDVPVLCMTATLQSGRKEQLRPLMAVYEDRPGELREIEKAERYRISCIQESEAEKHVRDSVNAGKRVLWVVNQVSRAQSIFNKLKDIGVPLVCYHSRFRLDDRVRRHRETVNAIKSGEHAAVAITTQVCEMSLDIDADVLITEECPIPSLIQRMGRCRRGRDELVLKGAGDVFIYQSTATEKAYQLNDLVGLKDFLAFLQELDTVSQSDLAYGFDKFGTKTTESPKVNSFLSSGPYAVGSEDSFRDTESFNLPAVLNCDVQKYMKATKDKQPGFIVPVPRKLKPPNDPRLPRFLHVADERHYDPNIGYSDEPIR